MEDSPIELVLEPPLRDVAGIEVRRALPMARCRHVGPFVFFDEFGPARLAPGTGLDVRPHPHIGLATVTTLFQGELVHRDSLGTVQVIAPGAVNWMTAGRGIVHSERTPQALRRAGTTLAGVQVWVALPRAHEDREPAFVHHPAADLPEASADGVRLRLILGGLNGLRSPVVTLSETLYADLTLDAGASFALSAEAEERACYPIEGGVEIGGTLQAQGRMVVVRPGATVVLRAAHGRTRVLVLGGERLDGPRHVWWNFVSSSPDRIRQAAEDWKADRFARVPDETDFIPLPDTDPPPPVDYP